MAYATEAEYLAWTGDDTAPDDITARLEQASLDVELAILVDFDPEDADTAEALSKATVIHASREFNPSKSDTSEYESVTLGPLTLERGAAGVAAQKSAAARLVPLARDVLTRAGLMYRGVNVGRQGVTLL